MDNISQPKKRRKLRSSPSKSTSSSSYFAILDNLWEDNSEDDEDYVPEHDAVESADTPVLSTPMDQPQLDDDLISKRTRAHLSLKEHEIEQLEMALDENSSPLLNLEQFCDQEYLNFLASLQSGELDKEDDNDDKDYHWEDILNAEEPIDSEEYRNDRAVHVSKEELEGLMQDATLLLAETPEPPKPNCLFTTQQLQDLNKQLQDHYQLLIQVFLMSRLNSSQDKGAVVCIKNWNMLRELYQRAHESQLRQNKRQPSVFAFELPGLNLLEHLYNYALTDHSPTVEKTLQILNLFNPFFDTSLFIDNNSKPNRNPKLKFTPAEDNLLALGLQRYGMPPNWEKIQMTLLPSKTVKQIVNRYKNRSAKRAEDNPLKAFRTSISDALSPKEEALLMEGQAMYGCDWDRISKEFLPHREPIVLARAFQKYDRTRTKNAKANQKDEAPLEPFLDHFNKNFLRLETTQDNSPIMSPPQDDMPNNFFMNEELPVYYGSKDVNSTQNLSGSFELIEDLSDDEHQARDSLKCNEHWTDLEPEIVGSSESSPSDQDSQKEEKPKFLREEDRHILQMAKSALASMQTWETLSQTAIPNKTPQQIAARYEELLQLVKLHCATTMV